MDISLITYHKPKAPESEAYRMLRTNLGYTGVDKKHQIILVTSSRMQEGKSTTVSNLAITMAQSDHKVLIIDADMRRPKIHKLFGLDNLFGLTDLIVKNQSLDQVVKHCGQVKNLDIITSGEIPPMPSEILDSKKMQSMLDSLRDMYDYIIIDSPPILSVSDASILARIVDGVLLAVASNETHVDAIVTARRALEKVEANLIGSVLTKAKLGRRSYHYYYDYAEKK